jgi:type II secretory pathway pseudopilin PulG
VRRVAAFTLIEIVLAIVIMLLVMLVAVPSLTGVMADRRLRLSLDKFNGLVNQAHEHSVAEHRPYLVELDKGSVEVRPEVYTKDEDPSPIADYSLPETDSISLKFPAAMVKNPPPEWIFWPSGVCEPAIVDFAGRNGAWTVTYSPLNARPEVTKYVAR